MRPKQRMATDHFRQATTPVQTTLTWALMSVEGGGVAGRSVLVDAWSGRLVNARAAVVFAATIHQLASIYF